MEIKPYWRLIRHEYASANISSLGDSRSDRLWNSTLNFIFFHSEATPSTLSSPRMSTASKQKKRVKHEAELIVLLWLFFSSFFLRIAFAILFAQPVFRP
jgi:hypothetical protein